MRAAPNEPLDETRGRSGAARENPNSPDLMSQETYPSDRTLTSARKRRAVEAPSGLATSCFLLGTRGFFMSYANNRPRATGRQNSTSEPIEHRSALDPRVLRFLDELSVKSFFGKVVVSFQNGKVTDVRTEQTRKLEEL